MSDEKTTSPQEIEEYKKAINWLMETRSSVAIGNRMPQHAAALYELFFKKAKTEVDIFCKNLHSDVFDEPSVMSSLKSALENGIRVNILLQDRHDGECYSKVKDCGAISVKRASDTDAQESFNFCVRDQESFRYEKNNNTTEAYAKMYSPEDALKLHAYFQTMWARGLDYIPN